MNLINKKIILQSKKLNEHLKCIKKISVILLLASGLHLPAFADNQSNTSQKSVVPANEKLQQGISITGTVTDADGEPLPGVNVQVKGTQIGIITDADGKYTLNVPSNESVLMFSYVGFVTQETTVGNRQNININLSEDTRVMEEVVVVAYGIQKKASLTGAVSTIGSEKLENRVAPNLTSSLHGLASGVTVRTTSGDPGRETANITIRGAGTFSAGYRGPMIIIDGAEGNMDSVNPDDVESISILKNASASALYGSRAANGVILVTTKKGQRDATPKVTYSGIFGVTQLFKYHEFESDYATYMEVFNRVMMASGQATGKYSQAIIDDWRTATNNPNGTNNEWGVPNWLAYPNTDWAGVLFRDQFNQKHSLSVAGGLKNTNYLMSANFTENPGAIAYTGVKRYQLRVNLESKIANFITVGTQTYAIKDSKEPGDYSLALDYMGNTVPGMTAKYDGKFGGPESPEEDKTATNVNYILYSRGGDLHITRVNTSWYANVDILNGLTASLYYNYQHYLNSEKYWVQPTEMYSFRTNELLMGPVAALSSASISNQEDQNYNYTARAVLNYIKSFGDHDISAMLGYEQYYANYRRDYAERRGMMDWSITDITTATDMVSIGSTNSNGAQDDVAVLSYIGRLNYAYKNKYLFEANFRRDGSSRFSPENRWGTFPSFSAAWRISEESFMEGLSPTLSNLKLRASWGKLGNTTSGYYDWQSAYSKVNNSYGGAILNGLAQDKLGNPLIQWESVTDAGVGLDASFLNNRLGLELDYYNRLTEGILTSPAIYLTMGRVGAPTLNTSDMRNQGLEVKVDWNDRVGDFRYGVSANFSYNVNKIVKYLGKLNERWEGDTYVSNIGQAATVSGNQIRTEGHRIDEFFFCNIYKGTGTYKDASGNVDPNGGPKDGMIRTPEDLQWVRDMQAAGYRFNTNTVAPTALWYGEYIAADLNGDGIYGNSYDRTYQKKSQLPPYNFGLTLNAAWKGFDFNMHWSGIYGAYFYFEDMGVNGSWVDSRRPISKHARTNHYYYNENDPNDAYNNITGKYVRLRYNHSGAGFANEVYLNNASHLRLKFMQIGYNFPKQWVGKAKLSNLRLFFTGENLLTFTSYIGLDPEVAGSYYQYPTYRQMSFGINVTF